MKTYCIIFFAALAICLPSCKKFLDEKQNSLYGPLNSVEACQIVLNNSEFNFGFPSDVEAYADNYYIKDLDWASLPEEESRKIYLRTPDAQRLISDFQWLRPYKTIYSMNIILEALEKIDSGRTVKEVEAYHKVKGIVFFYRAFCFHQLVSLYAKPYDPATANEDLSVPLRLDPNFTVPSERGSVKQTYDQIINDLQVAVDLLPRTTSASTLPNKVAAYAELARVYLSMEEYVLAGAAANAALLLSNILIDYETLNVNLSNPFDFDNKEIIFFAGMTSRDELLKSSRANIDSNLYKSYNSSDLRKALFFRNDGDGTYSFKGNYSSDASTLFLGLATNELYLIRAESYARAGSTTLAMNDLNTLLSARWAGTYTNMTAINADDALAKILTERRKELIFRGLRWTDLRRLNKDPRFAITLSRTVDGNVHDLPPNDLRYTLLFPQDVINNSTMTQNPR